MLWTLLIILIISFAVMHFFGGTAGMLTLGVLLGMALFKKLF